MKMLRFPAFAVAIPEEWEEQSTYVFVDPQGTQRKSTLVVTSEPAVAELPLRDHVDRQEALLRHHLNQVEIVEPAQPASVGGRDAIRLGLVSLGPDGRKIRQLQYYVRIGRRIYTLTFTQTQEDFKREARKFEEILQSFRLADHV